MNLPQIASNGKHAEASKLADPPSEEPAFDAWHYRCVLHSAPGTKRASLESQPQAQAPGGQPELSLHKISGSEEEPPLLSQRIVAERSQSDRRVSKLENAIGTASRNARKTREMRRLFGTYDEDNDGLISSNELGSVMKKLGLKINEDDLNCMVRSVDKNGDGYVDFQEFIDFQESLGTSAVDASGSAAGGSVLGAAAGDDQEPGRRSQQQQQQHAGNSNDDELREAFDVFDKNGDGFISVKELHGVLRNLGISAGATLTNCEKMISAVDRNGDGQVDFLEFKDLMTADSLFP